MRVFLSDVNECETLPSACVNGQCVNNQGSYRCECHFGFTLAQDGRTCLGISSLSINSELNRSILRSFNVDSSVDLNVTCVFSIQCRTRTCHVCVYASMSVFRGRLKTFLFRRSFR